MQAGDDGVFPAAYDVTLAAFPLPKSASSKPRFRQDVTSNLLYRSCGPNNRGIGFCQVADLFQNGCVRYVLLAMLDHLD